MKKLAILAVVLCCGAMGVALAMPVMANPWNEDACKLITDPNEREIAGCDSNTNLYKTAGGIINVITGVVGVIAVLMIVVGGLNLASSAGDPGKAAKARKTILFSVIGLLVALSAWAMVNFVLQNA